jgi:hypothetical protein
MALLVKETRVGLDKIQHLTMEVAAVVALDRLDLPVQAHQVVMVEPERPTHLGPA